MLSAKLNIIILAAGQGKRMQSKLPKVLHPLAGKPLLAHIINTVQQLNPEKIFVVYGHGGKQVRTALADLPVQWVEQKEQLGTGHAVMQVMPYVDEQAKLLVLVGDTPIISKDTLQKLLSNITNNELSLLTAEMPNPTGLGRIIRDNNNKVIRIVEEKDATIEQRQIHETNTGIIATSAKNFKRWLPELNNNNAQGEYYLTDILAMAVAEQIAVNAVKSVSYEEVLTVNDRIQLAQLERYYQRQQAQKLMLAGVTLLDPARFDLRGEAHIANDVTIDVNVILEGQIMIGTNSYIGSNTILRNVKIGENVTIKANTVIEDAVIENNCTIGPFARIRPDSHLNQGVHIGNFVEIKKSTIGENSKINHLSYVGDAEIGKEVNIGAGTITCNYDGVNKHKTIIADNAFIGSNSSLIAPMTVGENATIGAGSAVRGNIPADALAVTRAEQRIVEKWQRPRKQSDKK